MTPQQSIGKAYRPLPKPPGVIFWRNGQWWQQVSADQAKPMEMAR